LLKLTKRADYGLIAVKHLAGNGHSASAKEIAGAYGISVTLMAKILQKLTRTGVLASLPGTNGGYRLARDPSQISALEVIRAIDGPVLLTSCLAAKGVCDQSERCNIKEPLRKVHQAILALLGGIMISDMSRDQETVQITTYENAYLS